MSMAKKHIQRVSHANGPERRGTNGERRGEHRSQDKRRTKK